MAILELLSAMMLATGPVQESRTISFGVNASARASLGNSSASISPFVTRNSRADGSSSDASAGESRGDSLVDDGSSDETQAFAARASSTSIAGRLTGIVATFLSLAIVGFGLVAFGRPRLEIVSATAKESTGRAFVAGMLAQVLAFPIFGALVVGLALSVVGVLLIPFVLVVFGMLIGVAVLGGFLSVAHGMGETLVRQQMLRGKRISANSYRFLLVGLSSLGPLWLVWAVFESMPVAGTVISLVAAFATWVPATIGLGAAVLSRGGSQAGLTGRYLETPMMTDEYLWATPQRGVPAIKRPRKDT